MATPDGSHDKLPQNEAELVSRNLRHTGLWVPRTPPTAVDRWWGWNPAALLVGLVVGVLIWTAVIVFYGGRDDSPRPDVVVVTVTSVPSLTPYPSGWVPR